MWNAELLHASILAVAGGVGLVALGASVWGKQFTGDQPDWGHYKRVPAKSRVQSSRKKIAFALMIGLISLTLVASILTVVIASHG